MKIEAKTGMDYSVLDTGAGNDNITVTSTDDADRFALASAAVYAGEGANTVTLNGGVLAGSKVRSGNGTDKIHLNGTVDVADSGINAGGGNDAIYLGAGASVTNSGVLDGGAGTDTLNAAGFRAGFSLRDIALDPASVKDIEILDLTTVQANTLTLRASELAAFAPGALGPLTGIRPAAGVAATDLQAALDCKKNRQFVDGQNCSHAQQLGSHSFKVAFIITRRSELTCMESLIEFYLNEENADVNVYLYYDTKYANPEFFLSSVTHVLKNRNINFNMFNIKYFNNDITFISNPYLNESLYRKIILCGSKIIYLPYGVSISGEQYSENSHYNMYIHQNAWKIYTINEFYVNKYKNNNTKTHGNNVVSIKTTPKFDVALGIKNTHNRDKKTFLWNTHFDITPGRKKDYRTWSAYNVYCDVIYKYFLNNKDISLIIRPHPVLYYVHIDILNMIYDKFRSLDNVQFDSSITSGYEFPFGASDVFITDRSSMFFDFAVTGKPIISLSYENSCALNEFADDLFHKFSYMATTPSEFKDIMDNLISGIDPMRGDREALLKQGDIFDLSRPACAVIAEDIIKSLAAK